VLCINSGNPKKTHFLPREKQRIAAHTERIFRRAEKKKIVQVREKQIPSRRRNDDCQRKPKSFHGEGMMTAKFSSRQNMKMHFEKTNAEQLPLAAAQDRAAYFLVKSARSAVTIPPKKPRNSRENDLSTFSNLEKSSFSRRLILVKNRRFAKKITTQTSYHAALDSFSSSRF
jgi:hypothetical protein